MYYIINDNNSRILESLQSAPNQDELDDLAKYFNAPLYVIKGEHYGMTAEVLSPSEDINS